MLIAIVERRVGKPVHEARQLGDGIVCLVGIGGMPLLSVHCDDEGERAPPPDFDGVAQRVHAGRFADQAMVGNMAVRLHPLQHLHRAVDGGAFLVIGDEE